MSVSDLPFLNAVLNATSAILLLIGRLFIKRDNRLLHRKIMLSALGTSTLFLISYLAYHSIHGSQHFQGSGIARPVYFLILGTHTILAAAVVPMVLLTLRLALRGEFSKHRALARWTFPVWMYVSVTGVVIYLLLYRIFPGTGTM